MSYVFGIILPFFTAFFTSFFIIPYIIRFAIKFNIVDKPNSILKFQKKAVPYLGGFSVYIGLFSVFFLFISLDNNMMLLFLGISIMLVIGLIDDILELSPLVKMCGQVLVVVCLVRAGFYCKEIFLDNFFNITISFLWFLTIINAYNLVDVMDGLATSLAITNSIIFLILSIFLHQFNVAILLSAFIGALAAFFIFNKPSAKIYLGDSGSLFIGSFLASVPFLLSWSEYNSLGFISPILIFAIPLLELISLIFIRLYKRISPFKGSRDHFSLYLISNGLSKFQVLAFSCITSFFWGFIGLSFMFNLVGLVPVVCIGFIFIGFWSIFINLKKNVANCSGVAKKPN
jgi:UDP-GlcNAc:undecaprenyl-phosphate/decaprenyl-phosphate GlcNAc-1-phosphate transferase